MRVVSSDQPAQRPKILHRKSNQPKTKLNGYPAVTLRRSCAGSCAGCRVLRTLHPAEHPSGARLAAPHPAARTHRAHPDLRHIPRRTLAGADVADGLTTLPTGPPGASITDASRVAHVVGHRCSERSTTPHVRTNAQGR
eukprot:scaffold2742_cov130-Isochrysis_galbana.AAC.13